MPQLILVILFVLYLVFNFRIPRALAESIDTSAGKIVVIVLALSLFAYSNPILGVLGILVAFELIKRSTIVTGRYALEKYYPTETKKWSPFNPRHQFPYTLEQEVVKKMAPIRKVQGPEERPTFKPVLDNLHDAAPVNYAGVI